MLILATLASAQVLWGQTTTGDIKTAGNCSPVVIQPKDGFEIICHDNTLTRAEALKQARQISELLSKLRAESQNNREMIRGLDKILQQLNDMNAVATQTNAKLALATAPIYTIPVIDGVATPDLSHGLTQRVLLHSDVIIAAPRPPHTGKGETITWTLFVDEDGAGFHHYKTDFLESKTNWPGLVGNSRVSIELITQVNGSTDMKAVPIVNALKAESHEK